jgi:hypothetical protein
MDFHLMRRYIDLLVEMAEEDFAELKPSSILRELTPQILAEVQRIYDEWEQDEDGVDVEYGSGGPCETIAEAIGSVLAGAGVNVTSGGDDEHALIIAQFSDGVFAVDIPFCVYERGAGYVWKKIPGVVFQPSDITVDKLENDPQKFLLYGGE